MGLYAFVCIRVCVCVCEREGTSLTAVNNDDDFDLLPEGLVPVETCAPHSSMCAHTHTLTHRHRPTEAVWLRKKQVEYKSSRLFQKLVSGSF